MSLLLSWVVQAAALWAASQIVPGVRVDSWTTLAIGSAVLGVVNTVVRPVLTLLTFPLTLLTLGLFYFVVNGMAFGLAAALVPGFDVATWWAAVLGALVTGLAAWILGAFLKPGAASPAAARRS